MEIQLIITKNYLRYPIVHVVAEGIFRVEGFFCLASPTSIWGKHVSIIFPVTMRYEINASAGSQK